MILNTGVKIRQLLEKHVRLTKELLSKLILTLCSVYYEFDLLFFYFEQKL